jgi:signal transduction histidine kinase
LLEALSGLSELTHLWYHAIWLRLIAGATAIPALWMLHRWRVCRIEAQLTARFEERLAERSVVASDLHDALLQSVEASKMVADQALYEDSADPIRLRQTIVTLSGWLDRAIADGKTALSTLKSPAESNELATAFRRAAEVAGVAQYMEFVIRVEGSAREVHPIVRDDICRAGSEVIRNSMLHSGGRKLSAKISYGADLIVRIGDDGRGIDPATLSGGSGLTEIQIRSAATGGRVRFFSRVNCGTEFELRIPGRLAYRKRDR